MCARKMPPCCCCEKVSSLISAAVQQKKNCCEYNRQQLALVVPSAFTVTVPAHNTNATRGRAFMSSRQIDAKPVFFLHVSSSGGTAVCRWAQEQPCGRVPSCGANCNLNCHHPWDWVQSCRPPACKVPSRPCKSPFKLGCGGLARYARRRNLTFFASETMLHEAPCLRSFTYVTVLRDPIERLQSQFSRMHGQHPNTRLRELLSAAHAFNTSERSSLMGPAAVDNYLVRLLAGPEAFFLPAGGINASHFHRASSRLSRFDVAIPIENLSTFGTTWMQTALGWEGTLTRANSHRRRRRIRSTDGGTPRTFGERSLRKLQALNKFDLQLISEARSRFAIQVHSQAGQLSWWRRHQAEGQGAGGCSSIARQCSAGRTRTRAGMRKGPKQNYTYSFVKVDGAA
jgi:hypothetical protein